MANRQEKKDHNTTQDGTAVNNKQSPDQKSATNHITPQKIPEHGGPKGLEPTRYGDWEQNGRCTDF